MALLPNNTVDSKASASPPSANVALHTVEGPPARRRRSPHSRLDTAVRRRSSHNDDDDDRGSKTTPMPCTAAALVQQHDTLPVPATMVSRVGDLDREQEIERRLAELGLTEYKRRHEQGIAESLDSAIIAKDGLAAVVRRCRRRQRESGPDKEGPVAERPVDEIKKLVQQKIFRNARGEKIAYEIRIFLGCFTKDVTFQTEGSVVIIRCTTADDESTNVGGCGSGNGVKLTKDITVELPKSADWTRLRVTCSGGVVRIHAPIGDAPLEQHGAPLKSWKADASAKETTRCDEYRLKPEHFTSVSLLYSLHRKLMATSDSASQVGK